MNKLLLFLGTASIAGTSYPAYAQEANETQAEVPNPPPALKNCPNGKSVTAAESCTETTEKKSASLQPLSTVAATSAPESTALRPADKKAAKKLRKKNRADLGLCLNRSKLQNWMINNMLSACDRLLSQKRPFKRAYIDRPFLLHYRALAMIAAGHIDKAIEAIDESNSLTALKADPLSNDSIVHSNNLMLSFIHNMQGDKEVAAQLIDSVRKARPYSKTFQASADNLKVSFDPKLSNLISHLENRLTIDPNRRRSLIFLYLLNDDLQASYDVGQKLSLINPRQKGRWTRKGDNGEVGKISDSIIFQGTRAYVATILGKKEEADIIYSNLEEDFVDFLGNDPRYKINKEGVRVEHEKYSKKKLKRYNQRVKDVKKFRDTVADWQALTDLRVNKNIPSLDAFTSETEPLNAPFRAFPAYLDLLRNTENSIDATSENDNTGSTEQTKKLFDIFIDNLVINPKKIARNELGSNVFVPEHLDILPKYRSDNRISFVSGNNGFSQKREKNADGDIRTIRFESTTSTAPIAEEMMFLALSDYATEDGKTKFILLANETVKRTLRFSGYRNYSTDAGYVAQARVKFLTDAEAAQESPANQANIMSIADIEQNLRPKYNDYEKRKIIAKNKAKAEKKKK